MGNILGHAFERFTAVDLRNQVVCVGLQSFDNLIRQLRRFGAGRDGFHRNAQQILNQIPRDDDNVDDEGNHAPPSEKHVDRFK